MYLRDTSRYFPPFEGDDTLSPLVPPGAAIDFRECESLFYFCLETIVAPR